MLETLEAKQVKAIRALLKAKHTAVSQELSALMVCHSKQYVSKLSELVLLEDLMRDVTTIVYGNNKKHRRY